MLILLVKFQELYKGDGLVRYYNINSNALWADFVVSMIKIGNIKPLAGNNGDIQSNCWRIN